MASCNSKSSARRTILLAAASLALLCACGGIAQAQSSALEKARKMKEEAAARAKVRLNAEKEKKNAKEAAQKPPPKPQKPKDTPKKAEAPKEPVVKPMRRRASSGEQEEEKENKPAEPTCYDKIRNGDETDVDCGGKCRTTTRKFLGHDYPRLCNQEQACKINADCISKLCDTKRNKCKPRPVGALYTKDELKRTMHVVFDQLASSHADGKLRPNNVKSFIEGCINPDNQDVDSAEDRSFVERGRIVPLSRGPPRIERSRQPLTHGYLTGGKPFKFVYNLAKQLHERAAARSSSRRREL